LNNLFLQFDVPEHFGDYWWTLQIHVTRCASRAVDIRVYKYYNLINIIITTKLTRFILHTYHIDDILCIR